MPCCEKRYLEHQAQEFDPGYLLGGPWMKTFARAMT